MPEARPLAIVTGASAGIGYALAQECVENGFDLVIAADQPKIEDAAAEFRGSGGGSGGSSHPGRGGQALPASTGKPGE